MAPRETIQAALLDDRTTGIANRPVNVPKLGYIISMALVVHSKPSGSVETKAYL